MVPKFLNWYYKVKTKFRHFPVILEIPEWAKMISTVAGARGINIRSKKILWSLAKRHTDNCPRYGSRINALNERNAYVLFKQEMSPECVRSGRQSVYSAHLLCSCVWGEWHCLVQPGYPTSAAESPQTKLPTFGRTRTIVCFYFISSTLKDFRASDHSFYLGFTWEVPKT